MGVPMIISKPHFLDADKSLLKSIEGIKPDRKLHDNFLQFEMVRKNTKIDIRFSNWQFSMI